MLQPVILQCFEDDFEIVGGHHSGTQELSVSILIKCDTKNKLTTARQTKYNQE